MSTSSDLNTLGSEKNSPCAGLAPDAFPEARSSKNGVSVRYVHDPDKKWYVMRASYGREDKALDLIVADGTFSYIAKRYAEKYVNGKRRRVLESLIPNLLFVYTTKEKAEEYVKGTPALSYITYYYNHFELDDNQKNPPLTVSCAEMDNFMLATASMNEHLMFVQPSQCHFRSGELVKVIEGPFTGVEGRVARVAGQQRVILTLSEVGLISTAYVPTAFIRKIEQ